MVLANLTASLTRSIFDNAMRRNLLSKGLREYVNRAVVQAQFQQPYQVGYIHTCMSTPSDVDVEQSNLVRKDERR